MKPVVIYHKNCADGFAAAWCFWREFKDSYEYYPSNYQQEVPDFSDRDLILVDFSYKKEVILELLEKNKSIVVIDHHKSAIEGLKDIQHPKFNLIYDLDKSGCVLAWEYVYTRSVPRLLLHIQDRDLWKFKLEYTREIMAAVFSYDYSFETYTELIEATALLRLYTEGKALERKYWKDLKELLKSTKRTCCIGSWNIPVANMPFMFASDAANLMAAESSFAACYTDVADGRIFSLRSVGDFDVSKIAELYGGGGHKNAAGFKVARNHLLSHI